MDDLLTRVLISHQGMLAMGNECFEAAGAMFIRNRGLPLSGDANHVARIAAQSPEEIRELFARADLEFAGLDRRRFDVDPLTPPEVEARLAFDGYECASFLLMLLRGPLYGTPRQHDIRLVDGPEMWTDYITLYEADAKEWSERWPGTFHPEVARELLAARNLSRAAVRFWIAYLDGRPAAYCSSYVGPTGVGQVDDLFTHPKHRHHGLATALIGRCVDHCRANGAAEVFLVADAADTPRQMYAALGFEPFAMLRHYSRGVQE